MDSVQEMYRLMRKNGGDPNILKWQNAADVGRATRIANPGQPQFSSPNSPSEFLKNKLIDRMITGDSLANIPRGADKYANEYMDEGLSMKKNAANRLNQLEQPPPVKAQNKAAKNAALLDDARARAWNPDLVEGAADARLFSRPKGDNLANKPQLKDVGMPTYGQERLTRGDVLQWRKSGIEDMARPIVKLPMVAGALGGASGVMSANDLRNDVNQNGPIAGYAKWLGLQTKNPTQDYE